MFPEIHDVKLRPQQDILTSKIVMENMTAFTRAGADIIITYHARDIVEKGWL